MTVVEAFDPNEIRLTDNAVTKSVRWSRMSNRA